MSRNYTSMRGWTYLAGPGWWTGEDAMWARKAKDGAWFVLRFTDLLDAGGKDFKDTPFECDVRRIHLKELPEKEVDSALRSCGWEWKKDGDDTILVNDQGSVMRAGERLTLAAVEMCVSYGLGAPLYSATGKRWLHVRAEARREAEGFLKGTSDLDAALDRPVNAIGSTAREYGLGDISSALARGPATREKELVKKLQGAPIVRVVRAQFFSCPFTIIALEHWREDGSCKCNSAAERKRMMAEWEYTEKQMAKLPPAVLP
jgi:hypothetical protein